MTCVFADPREWVLEISPALQGQSWQQSQVYATPSRRWCAYINQICLEIFLNWLRTEYLANATAGECIPGVPGFWEFVNGTVVLLGQKRVVLIPSEAIDDGELEVPQEWVDLPSWAADYYLAVQIKADGDWVRFWGYTTHQELKSLANYDPVDRTYCLDAQHLTKDLNAFWMTYQFSTEEMKTAIAPLPELSATQAENLCQRLGNSSVTFPRLAVPFTTWGALLENQQWRQHLYQQRQQRQQLQSSTEQVNLSGWLEGIYETSWKTIETFLGTNSHSLAFNFRNSGVEGGRVISIGSDNTPIILIVRVTETSTSNRDVVVEILPELKQEYLPSGLQLLLLDSDGDPVMEATTRQDSKNIKFEFTGTSGEAFSIKLELFNNCFQEDFIL